MAEQALVHARVDKELKQEVTEIYVKITGSFGAADLVESIRASTQPGREGRRLLTFPILHP